MRRPMMSFVREGFDGSSNVSSSSNGSGGGGGGGGSRGGSASVGFSVRSTSGTPAARRRQMPAEDSWLDDDDDDDDDDGDSRSRSSSSSSSSSSTGQSVGIAVGATGAGVGEDEEEVDPLEAFMAANDLIVKDEGKTAGFEKAKAIFLDEEEPDSIDDYMKQQVDGSSRQGGARDGEADSGDGDGGGDSDLEYDEDGRPICSSNKAKDGVKAAFELLAPVDHEAQSYPRIRNNFYQPHDAIAARTRDEVQRLALEMSCTATGDPPGPIQSFVHVSASFGAPLIKAILDQGFEAPTPIQCAALPVALSGRDMIGLASTGSGKTLSFLWPMLVHCQAQERVSKGEGPIGLILAPTRELAEQIFREAKRYSSVCKAKCALAVGGAGKWEMAKALKDGAEILVASPGRLMEFISSGATNLHSRCTMVVLDEADRLLDLGFEAQLTSILQQVRPNRQTLLFSATLMPKVKRLVAAVFKTNKDTGTTTQPPACIQIGVLGQASEDVSQNFEVLPSDQAKWVWLSQSLGLFLNSNQQDGGGDNGGQEEGKALIFVSRKASADELAENLNKHGWAGCAGAGNHAGSGGGGKGGKGGGKGGGGGGKGGSGASPSAFVACIHGDLDQHARSEAVRDLKSGKVRVLVATDVAARGLDIRGVTHVINYDAAKNIESHVHRIGRTGRLGVDGANPGTAHTLLTRKDADFAASLVRHLREADKPVPQPLLDLSRQLDRGGGSGKGKGKGGGKGSGNASSSSSSHQQEFSGQGGGGGGSAGKGYRGGEGGKGNAGKGGRGFPPPYSSHPQPEMPPPFQQAAAAGAQVASNPTGAAALSQPRPRKKSRWGT